MRQRCGRPGLQTGTGDRRWPATVAVGLTAATLSIVADWAIVRAIYGDRFAGHARLHTRFRPYSDDQRAGKSLTRSQLLPAKRLDGLESRESERRARSSTDKTTTTQVALHVAHPSEAAALAARRRASN